MLFDVLTIFPDLFVSPLEEGILRKARQEGKIRIELTDIRDFAEDRHATTDDRPFGGGEGMVMKPDPLAAAVEKVRAGGNTGKVNPVDAPGPGKYTQDIARRADGREKPDPCLRPLRRGGRALPGRVLR